MESEDDDIDDGIPGNGDGDNIGIEVGQTAKDFYLVDTDNVPFFLSDFRGTVVVLDFMATWCGPCVQELEHLKEVYNNFTREEVTILSIDVDDNESPQKLSDFKHEHSSVWRFAPYGGSVGTTYKIANIPTMVIIDKTGTITYKNVGVTGYSILESEINKNL